MNVVLDDDFVFWDTKYGGSGYIAGEGEGIVTIKEFPAARQVTILNAENYEVVRQVWSLENGHYWVPSLSNDYKYIIIARDYEQQFEPAVWDLVVPAVDRSYSEQQALWESWQK